MKFLFKDIVMLLLSHGADISILNTEGHTPKTLAPSPVKRFLEGELLKYF